MGKREELKIVKLRSREANWGKREGGDRERSGRATGETEGRARNELK